MKTKTDKPKICICKDCGRSSVVGSKCAFEDLEQMAFCPTFIKQKNKVR